MALKSGFAVAIVVLTSGASFAADMAAPIAPQVFTWTGCFAGVHGGVAGSYDEIRSSNYFSNAGFVGGGQIGCDYQLGSALVVGVEGRAAWSSLTSRTPGTGINGLNQTFPVEFTVGNELLASATARLGYAYPGGWLLYTRGGVAWTHEKTDIAYTPPNFVAVDPTVTSSRTGWTFGTGMEWAFAPHWSTNLEYDYYEFGDHNYTAVDSIHHATFTGSLKDTIQALTLGLNLRF